MLVLAFSLFSFSKNLQAGIHYKKGLNALQNKNFLTAQKEFQKVVDKEPGYLKAQCQLMIAAYHNQDLQKVADIYLFNKNEKIEDEDLYGETTDVLQKTALYYRSDSFDVIWQKYESSEKMPEAVLRKYISAHDDEIYPLATYAGKLYDKESYSEADSVLDRVLSISSDFHAGVVMKISTKRELGQFDSAYFYINKLLAENHQDLAALSSKVRLLLKQKKDEQALALGKYCLELGPSDASVLSSLALVYHYKHDFKNRDAIVTKADNDSNLAPSFIYVKDVISGKENFRN